MRNYLGLVKKKREIFFYVLKREWSRISVGGK